MIPRSVRYEGEHILSVVALDSEFRGQMEWASLQRKRYLLQHIFQTARSGFAAAWVIARPEVIRKLVMIKQAADLHTSSFNQYVAYEVAKADF